MDTQKIQEALDTLSAAFGELNDTVTLSVKLTKRDVEVLNYVTLASVSVPRTVADLYNTTAAEVRDVLAKIQGAIQD